VFLHGVADEDERPDLGALGFIARVGEHPTDLRRSAAHIDSAHELPQALPAGDEVRRPAFVQTPKIDKLHVEAAKRACRLEHLCLQ